MDYLLEKLKLKLQEVKACGCKMIALNMNDLALAHKLI
jgi:hypothetical protein